MSSQRNAAAVGDCGSVETTRQRGAAAGAIGGGGLDGASDDRAAGDDLWPALIRTMNIFEGS